MMIHNLEGTRTEVHNVAVKMGSWDISITGSLVSPES